MPAVPASSLDGKEGVDGSSPSEGFQKSLQMPVYRTERVAQTGDEGPTPAETALDRRPGESF